MKAYFPELNEAIVKATAWMRVQASDRAPGTFEELARHCTPQSVVVWAGASDRTIYGDPSVNWKFRAWHDRLHLELNAPFTLEGELWVARAQAASLGGILAEVVMVEVADQAQATIAAGSFVKDQIEFTLGRLALKGIK